MGLIMNYTDPGDYLNRDAVEKAIRYITRTNNADEIKKRELILFGSPNVLIYGENGINNAITEFKAVQAYYHGEYIKGPKLYHESFNLTEEEARLLLNNIRILDELALACAREYASLGHQVVYAVHYSKNKGLHIHFVCNAVSFEDGLKWHYSIKEQKKRQSKFNQLLQELIIRINQTYLFPLPNLPNTCSETAI